MNTNIVEGSYVMIKKFMEEGGDVFNNKHYNKVLCDYHNYLVSSFLKKATILQRLVSAYWFLKYAENYQKQEKENNTKNSSKNSF